MGLSHRKAVPCNDFPLFALEESGRKWESSPEICRNRESNPGPSGGEHPVSANFRGLRNRFVRWWVLGAPHEQPIFTSVFEKNVIFSGANRVSATFQPRFSCVSAAIQLRFSSLRFLSFEISVFLVPKYQRSSKSNFWSNFLLCVSAAFQLAKTGCSPSGPSGFQLRVLPTEPHWPK